MALIVLDMIMSWSLIKLLSFVNYTIAISFYLYV